MAQKISSRSSSDPAGSADGHSIKFNSTNITSKKESRLRDWLLVLVVQRLAAILLLRPGGFFYDYTDYHTYWMYARLFAEGFWPYRDFWLEYPPLFPLFNQAIYALSLYFPDATRFSHHLFLALSLLPFDLGIVVLLYRIMRRMWDAARAEWAVAAWVLFFGPLFLWQGHFDTLPLFGLMLVVWAMIERRPVWAGVGLAFGFLTKLLSVLAIPAALWAFAKAKPPRNPYIPEVEAETPLLGERVPPEEGALWIWSPLRLGALFSRENGLMLGTFVLLVTLVMAPLFVIGPEWMVATIRNFGGRGAWQTVWALADGFYGYGLVHGDRFNPSPEFVAAPSRVPWLLVHALFALVGGWLWTRRWRWERPKVQVAFVSVTVYLFYLWSKGWSPQFTLMLLPWILFLLPDGRGLALVVFLTTLMGSENIYYAFVVHRTEAPWMLITIILLRTAALIGLTALAVGRLRAWSDKDQ
ncbi:MAG: hypothetical protein ACPGWR_20970 [Ardenticatenaceae bacterium]